MAKYTLSTTDTITVSGSITLHRIIYTIDIPEWSVFANKTLGGYIEKEDNLSQDGSCVVLHNARAWGKDTRIEDGAALLENGTAFFGAKLTKYFVQAGSSKMFEYSTGSDHAFLGGNARVMTYSTLKHNSIVNGNSNVVNSILLGNAIINDNDVVINGKVVAGNLNLDILSSSGDVGTYPDANFTP